MLIELSTRSCCYSRHGRLGIIRVSIDHYIDLTWPLSVLPVNSQKPLVFSLLSPMLDVTREPNDFVTMHLSHMEWRCK